MSFHFFTYGALYFGALWGGGGGSPVFSTESLEIIIGYFQGKKEKVELLQHTVERNYLFFNFFGLNSYTIVDCNVSVLNSVTKVFLLSLLFLNPKSVLALTV